MGRQHAPPHPSPPCPPRPPAGGVATSEQPHDERWAQEKAEELKQDLAEAEAGRKVEYNVAAHQSPQHPAPGKGA